MLRVVLLLIVVVHGVDSGTEVPPFDACNSLPCSNGGTCISKGGGFSCSCPEGFAGYQCEITFSKSRCMQGWKLQSILYGPEVCYKEYKEPVAWKKAWDICHEQHASMDVYFNLTSCSDCPITYLNHWKPGSMLWTGGYIYGDSFRWDGYKQPIMVDQADKLNMWDPLAFSSVDNKCVALRVNGLLDGLEGINRETSNAARRRRALEISQFSLATETCDTTKHPFGCVRNWELNFNIILNAASETLCPGFDFESEEMGLCYKFDGLQVNKTEAEKICRLSGGEIPSVRSQADMNILGAISAKSFQFLMQKEIMMSDIWVNMESTDKSTCYQLAVVDGTRYQRVGCERMGQVFCQKRSATGDVKFIRPSSYAKLIAGEFKRDIVCSLNVANSRTTNVYWVKRDRILKGAIPGKNPLDFPLAVSSNFSQQGIDRSIFRTFADVPGYYWCEKITNNPPKTIRSNTIFVELPEEYLVYIAQLYLLNSKYPFNACYKESVVGVIELGSSPYSSIFKMVQSNAAEVLPSVLRGLQASQIYTKLINVNCTDQSLHLHMMMKLTDNVNYNEDIMKEFESRLNSLGIFSEALRKPIVLLPVVCQNTVKLYHGDTEYKVTFQGGRIGSKRNSTELCQADGTPMAEATCRGNFDTGAYWDIVMTQTCNFTDLENSNSTLTLLRLSQSQTDRKTVEGIANDTKHLTLEPTILTSKDVIYVADILTNVVEVGEITPTVAEDAIEIIDSVLSMDVEKIVDADKRGSAAQRILKAVDAIGVRTDLLMETKFRTVRSNIALEIWEMSGQSDIVVGLMLTDDNATTTTSTRPLTNDSLWILEDSPDLEPPISDAAILLPATFIRNQIKKLGQESLRLSMHIFNNRKLFIANTRAPDPNDAKDKVYSANSKVVAGTLSVDRRLITDLGGDNVTTVFLPFQETDAATCGYWEHGATILSNGSWETDGCEYYEKVKGRHVCMCNHLTNFAILMDFGGQTPIAEAHKLALSIITIIGLSISIAALFLTILSFIVFKKLREGRGQKTLFNLSLALICSWIIFLAGINQTQDYAGCIVVAALIHYFLLVAFMWMCVEAFLQYLRFVQVLGTYIPKFMLKTAIPAWCIPLIPVIIVLAIDTDLYKGGNDYCWMTLTAFYYSFAIPVGVMILFNIVIYFIVVWNICRRPKGLQSTQSKSDLRMLNVRAALSVFVLLGLTWIFGFLTVSDARIAFSYIFAILNAFQGLFIFILFTLRDKFFREQWTSLCCPKKSKPGEKQYVKYSTGSSASHQSSNYTSNSSQGRSSISTTNSDPPLSVVNDGFDAPL